MFVLASTLNNVLQIFFISWEKDHKNVPSNEKNVQNPMIKHACPLITCKHAKMLVKDNNERK